MNLRRYFGCNPDQPRWCNRLRFVYMVPTSLLVTVLVLIVVMLTGLIELITGLGCLRAACRDAGHLFKAFFASFPELIWPAMKKAWSMGT